MPTTSDQHDNNTQCQQQQQQQQNIKVPKYQNIAIYIYIQRPKTLYFSTQCSERVQCNQKLIFFACQCPVFSGP